MKRLQISLEPELDDELERVARAGGVSKAEIVRRCLREGIESKKPWPKDDPFFELIGAFEGKPGDPTDVSVNHDHYIYGTPKKWPS
ncbi:MAG TPA: CopG family transcriptional regulator [Solirubrobacterales bacterium]|nr:CopG family transcriptional regulator [Solirubrobacterales bacterium]